MPSRSLRVAVIGAGAAGLVAARELRREGHAPVVFERTDGMGSTWVYEAGADASATPEPPGGPRQRSNLYASPGHAEVLRYLQSFARRFDLHGLVRPETEVVRVSREASGASWRVRYSRKASGGEKREAEEEVFDAVVVCNGHYSQPHFADVAGVDAWPGKQLHSTSYRVPEPFHGQVVVVIGCGPSGTDISRDIAGVAKEVHLASRSAFAATSDKLPGHANMWLHSEIECVQEDGSVVFHDGSRVKADVIMHCTGYKYNIPFLNSDATVSVDGNCVEPLYKHVFPPKAAPQLSFIGLPLKVIPFPLFELQSHWVAGILSGRFQLPSEEEMMRDVTAFYSRLGAREWPRRYTHRLRDREFENEDWLAEQCRRDGPEEWRREMFAAAIEVMGERPETYRDEWDGGDYDHLLAQANRDFAAHLPAPLWP
ncbi:hypothetical protein ZWY2020_014584 [Hordeum vulgare]|nr:hypothetical protein ZWY2020_014584 [Hordeum vulgare]